MRKIQVFDANFHALFEKSILFDEKYHFEGASKAKMSEKYRFSKQNFTLSSKKASFWMKNIILKVYQKLKSQKNTCFQSKISRSLEKKHPFEFKASFWRYGCPPLKSLKQNFTLFSKKKHHFESFSNRGTDALL